jgi:uncharacterized protein (TIGR02145 family)
MKKIFVITQIIIIVCLSNNCIFLGTKHHRGYVYTFDNRPIKGLRVYPGWPCKVVASAGGITDENGYFEFRHKKSWISRYLNIELEGRIIDSIYNDIDGPLFVKERADTLFIDTSGERGSLIGCYKKTASTDRTSYYEGYICTFEKQPIQNLRVYPSDCKFFRCTAAESGGITDENGYFKIMMAEDWITTDLIVESEGRAIDSTRIWVHVPSYRGLFHSPILSYRVHVDGRRDTILIDIQYEGWLSRKRYEQGPAAEKPEPLLDDRDGQQYGTVKIGNRTWMAENLNIKIGNSWCYNDDETYCNAFGRLYDWKTAMNACPAGWHLPYSRHEWGEMLIAAGGTGTGMGTVKNVGNKLRATSGWRKGRVKGTDDYGFSAIAGGYRSKDGFIARDRPTQLGPFVADGLVGGWWTASEYPREYNWAIYRIISNDYNDVHEKGDTINSGYSVRCVQDVAPMSVSAEKIGQAEVEVDARDGQQYRTVKIGKRTWMAENLNYDADRSWCYGEDESNYAKSNCAKYGRLYDWKTATRACMAGWHLPTFKEWVDLVVEAGHSTAGKKLKAKSGWATRWGNGTDDYGFSALPGGEDRWSGFEEVGSHGHWWTATEDENDRDCAYHLEISNHHDDININNNKGIKSKSNFINYCEPKGLRFSVRCVRDDE